MTVEVLEEVCDLFGGFRVDDPAEARRGVLAAVHAARVRDHADRHPLQPSGETDHLRCEVGLELVLPPRVEDASQDLAHVVRLAMVAGKNVVGSAGSRPGTAVQSSPAAGGAYRLTDQVPDPLDARLVVGNTVVSDAGDLRVDARTPQLLGIDDLSGRALHEVGSAQPHERRSSTMRITSSAGRYAPPAMQGPITAAIWGRAGSGALSSCSRRCGSRRTGRGTRLPGRAG